VPDQEVRALAREQSTALAFRRHFTNLPGTVANWVYGTPDVTPRRTGRLTRAAARPRHGAARRLNERAAGRTPAPFRRISEFDPRNSSATCAKAFHDRGASNASRLFRLPVHYWS